MTGESPRPRTFIQNLDFVATVNTTDDVISDATVVLEEERIVAVGKAAEMRRRYPHKQIDVLVDGRRRGLVPGFVDLHVHLSETLSRASFPDNLSTRPWVFHWIMPYYGQLTPEDERVSVLLAAIEMLSSGTTCFLDMGAINGPEVTIPTLGEVGIRVVTGRHAADVMPPEIPAGWSAEMIDRQFFPNAKTALEVLEECVRAWDGYANGRVRCWVNIQGKEPCSAELHAGAVALSARLGVGTTFHSASTAEEAEISERRHGMTPIARMSDIGALDSHVVLAHGVAASESDIELLAAHRTSVAFCPGTSLKLAKGATAIGKYPEMMDRGVTVGLGTDGVSASGNLNLMRQLYLVAGLFKDARMNPDLVGARRALRMATIDGARALGLADEIGSIEPGKKADFIMFNLDHPEWVPYSDPIQALAWSATTASLDQTWVDGRAVYRDGRVHTVGDEAALVEEARHRAAALIQRAGLHLEGVPTRTGLYG